MKKSLFILFFIFAILATAASLKERPVRICVIGDRTGDAQDGIYEGILEEIDLLRPDLILTVGDMIEGPADSYEEIDRRWKEYKEIISHTDIPVYFTPGNNDIFDSVSLDYYRKNISKPYYSVDTLGIHIVSIDNSMVSRSSKISSEQYDFLKNDLSKNKNSIVIVIMHKPFWKESVAKGESDSLHTLFKEYKVDLVLSGHYHEYFTGKYDGVRYVSVGSSGGAAWRDYAEDMSYHFTFITLDDKGIHIAPIKRNSVKAGDFVTSEENDVIGEMSEKGIQMEKLLYDEVGGKLLAKAVSLSVFNLTPENISGNLKWESNGNWNVLPSEAGVKVESGKNGTYTFDISKNGGLFPLPEASMSYSYSKSGKNIVRRLLTVSRSILCRNDKGSYIADGELSEKGWGSPIYEFSDEKGMCTTKDSTYLYMNHDKEKIRFGVECYETSMESAKFTEFKHDGAVYDDDCVSFLIASCEKSDKAYLFYINPTGVLYDAEVSFKDGKFAGIDPLWESGAEVKTTAGRKGWNLEMFVSMSSLGIEKGQNEFRMNFFRQRIPASSLSILQLPLMYEINTYSYVKIGK